MSESDDRLLFEARLHHILTESLAMMPEDVKAERVAYCQRTGEAGVRLLVEDGALRLTWGGELLATVELEAFEDDAYFRDLDVLATSVPDCPPDDTL